MKKLFILLTLTLIFTSCQNEYLENGKSKINSAKETNLEVLQKLDTTKKYYVVIDDDKLYAITEEKLVEYKIADSSGALKTIFMILIVLLLIIALLSIVFID